MNLKPILEAILRDYPLPIAGHHGVIHWARVWENGRRLTRETGANGDVVDLFAVLHDAKRVNEHDDPDHGLRGAELACELNGKLYELADHDFQLLHRACAGHTHELTHPDPTIQTCWDADRLDLGRVGIMPHPNRLCTATAKRIEVIKWAHERSTSAVVPAVVAKKWGVALPEWAGWEGDLNDVAEAQACRLAKEQGAGE